MNLETVILAVALTLGPTVALAQVPASLAPPAPAGPLAFFSGALPGSELFKYSPPVFAPLPEPILFFQPRLWETAERWLGTPYRFSGRSRKGVSCSGLVSLIFNDVFGVDLAGSSRTMFDKVVQIPRNALMESDLIFFKIRRNRISHVGIYLGNNKFLHASRSSGVVISDLDEPYYRKYFFAAGRLRTLLESPCVCALDSPFSRTVIVVLPNCTIRPSAHDC
jgi:hypothetical protein